MKKSSKFFIQAAVMAFLFVLTLFLVLFVDRKPIGVDGTYVGLAWINDAIFNALGTNHIAKIISEVVGYLSIAVALIFVGLFLYQWIKNKSLKKVEIGLFNLMIFYVVVGFLYVLFLFIKINYRPLELESSFPSSHTLLIVAILGSTMFYLPFLHKSFLTNKKAIFSVLSGLIALIVVGVLCRFFSGVHWFTDILAGVFLAAALVFALMGTNCLCVEKHLKKQEAESLQKETEAK